MGGSDESASTVEFFVQRDSSVVEHIKATTAHCSSNGIKATPSDALVEVAASHVAKVGDLSAVQLSKAGAWIGGMKDGKKHGFGYEYTTTTVYYEMDNRDCTTYRHKWAVYQDGAPLWEHEFDRNSQMCHS